MARINFSHGAHEVHGETIDTVRRIDGELGTYTAVLADLQGPKFRIGNLKNDFNLKKRDFFVYKDSLQVYLLKVFDYKQYNTSAPFEIVEANIEKILINRKKLYFLKNFDKEILDDAIQTKKLEIFP